MRVASIDGITALLNEGVHGGESIHAVPEGHERMSTSRQSHNDTVGANHCWHMVPKVHAKIKNSGHDRSTILVFTKSAKVSKDNVCAVTCYGCVDFCIKVTSDFTYV
jgi:hypothetical protein